jgi:hypothetical protein
MKGDLILAIFVLFYSSSRADKPSLKRELRKEMMVTCATGEEALARIG